MTVYLGLDTTLDRPMVCVKFPYNPKILEAIRVIPNRKYQKDRRLWLIPIQEYETLRHELHFCDVVVAEDLDNLMCKERMVAYLESYGNEFDVRLYPEHRTAYEHFFPHKNEHNRYNLEEMQWFLEFFHTVGLKVDMDADLKLKSLPQIPEDEVNNISNLNSPLRWFQKVGVRFLVNTRRALLADEMGIGKTPQAISSALMLKNMGEVNRVLIVVPASLKQQWADEIEYFTGLSATVVEGSKKNRKKLYSSPSFFIIVNYDLIYRDISMIKEVKPDLLVLDEIQRIKNHKTKTHQALKKIEALYRFGLTGTPIENKLEELFNIMAFINPLVFGSRPSFERRYIKYETKSTWQRHRGKIEYRVISGYKNIPEIRDKLQPVMLRRLKQDVLTELPPCLENDYYVTLTSKQMKLYRAVEDELVGVLKNNEATLDNALAKTVYLRQISDSAALVSEDIKDSAKLQELLNLLQDLNGRRVVIFTQYKQMGDIIEKALVDKGYFVGYVNGEVSLKLRDKIIKTFREGETQILLSTDCLQYGANLQVSDVLINFDLPWTDSKLQQRIGRVHRTGQKNPVNVINLIAAGTIEERVARLIMRKKGLATSILDGEEYTTGGISPETLQGLKELYRREIE